MNIKIKEIKGEKYIVVNSDLLILTDYIENGFEVFFMPTNKKDFEFATNREFVNEKLFPFELIKDEDDFEYLVKIDENRYFDLPIICKGKEVLKISNQKDFLDKLINNVEENINDISNLILNSETNVKRYFLALLNNNKELLEFLKNIKSIQ